MIRHIYLFFLLSLLAITGVWAQTTRYVKETATGTGLGTDWSNASNNLQAMIDASAVDDRVFVATGTYRPTMQRPTTIGADAGNRGRTFFIKSGVKLYGGFAGTAGTENDLSGRILNPSGSSLSGDSNSPFDHTDDIYHVVTFLDASIATRLDGFTVTKGYATAESATLLDNIGAAIYNKSTGSGSSKPTIANCLIIDNYASKGGAGLSNYAMTGGDASPTVENCRFDKNQGEGLGGAVLNYGVTFETGKNIATYTTCTFIDNRASLGSGVYNRAVLPRFTNCTFQNNRAQGQVEAPFGQSPNPGKGGGMYSTDQSRPVLLSCIFSGNAVQEAFIFGGDEGGGGLYTGGNSNATLINCLVTNNRADARGAGLYNALGSFVNLTNCTVADNLTNGEVSEISDVYEETDFGAPYSSQWLNSIVWSSSSSGGNQFSAGSQATFSIIQGGGLSGSDNLATNPLFVDAANANYRLQVGSPAVNSGHPASTTANVSVTDLGGDSRVQGRIDRGAYERLAPTPPGSPTVSGGTSQSTCQRAVEVTIFASCPAGSTPSFQTVGGSLNQNSFIVNTQQAGIQSYTAVCTANSSGLTSTLPFSITVVGTPAAPTVSSSPASATATAGNSISLTAACPTGSVAVWNVASTMGTVVTPTAVGIYNYQVRCQTPGGCTSPTIPASATVVIAQTPPNTFPAADLSIPKVDVTRREQTAGQRVRYVTHLLNQSSVTATNVRFRVQMPAGYAYSTDNSMTTDPTSAEWVGTPTSANTTYDVATNQVNVLVPAIGPGQRLLLFFYGFVPMTTGRNYQYWEIVSADNSDPDSTPDNGFCNGEDDTYSIDTRVGIPISVGADVVVFNNVSTSNANPAQNDVITISTGIRNNEGPEVATNVLTKITLPAGLSFVAATTPGVNYNSGSREVAYNATRIGVNEAVSFSFTARVVATSGSRIRVRAEVKSGDQVSYNAQFDNEQCNNDDDDTGETTITVSGMTVVPPSGVFSITGVTTVSCATVSAGLRTVTFTPRYAGLSGQPVSFSVVSEMLPTTAVGPYVLNIYTDNPAVTLSARQNGTAGNASFVYNWLAACNGGTTPPPPVVNQAPVVANGIPNQAATVGQAFSYMIPSNTFSDPNGDALTLSVTGLPTGLSLSGNTISGTTSVSGVSTITITATDPGSLVVSTSFVLTVNPTPVVVPPSGVFSITGVTTVSCATVSAGLRTVTFTPRYAGLSGQPVSFSVVSEMLPTTAVGPYVLNIYTDNPAVTLSARQNGTAGNASFVYNWLAACNGGSSGRLAALTSHESTPPLKVSVLGNPVLGETVQLDVRGAEGQPLRVWMSNLQGHLISEQHIEQAGAVERVSLQLSRSVGLYLLQVSSPGQTKVVRVLKIE